MIMEPYRPRFVPAHLIEDLLFCWRMTAVGHTVGPGAPSGVDPFSRYGRMLRAVVLFTSRNGDVPGAYKDLDGLLGVGPGQLR